MTRLCSCAGWRRSRRESARLRFLAPKNRLSLAELRYLTEVDHVDHYALVAVLADDPTTMAGVGRWVRDREHPDAAEVAIVVGDCHQGQGLGTPLGTALADGARALRDRALHRHDAAGEHRRAAALRPHLRAPEHARRRAAPTSSSPTSRPD